MDGQEKSVSRNWHAQAPSTRHQRQAKRPLRRVFFAVCLCLLFVLVAFSAPPARLWRGMHCGKTATEQAPGAKVESTPLTTLLDKYFPGRHQHGVSTAEPKATAVVRLGRRQDNSTSSSSTAGSSSSSTTSSTTPRSTSSSTSSSSSASSSSSPPTTPRTSSTLSSTPSGNGTPSQTPGTSSSSSQNNRSPNPTGSTGSVSSQAARTTPASSSDTPPSNIDGGTTLTRSTTLPGGTQGPQGQTVTRSSKAVIATLTTTLPNGSIVVVTQTSLVSADPTNSAGSANAPSLHNGASRQQSGSMAVLGLFGAVGGMMLA